MMEKIYEDVECLLHKVLGHVTLSAIGYPSQQWYMNVTSFGDHTSCTTVIMNSKINLFNAGFLCHLHKTGYKLNHSCPKGINIIHVYMFLYTCNIFTTKSPFTKWSCVTFVTLSWVKVADTHPSDWEKGCAKYMEGSMLRKKLIIPSYNR